MKKIKKYFKELGYSKKQIKNDIKDFFIETAFVVIIVVAYCVVKTT